MAAIPACDLRAARILICRLSSIGDVITSTPVAKALRQALPDAHLAWVVENQCKDIVLGNPYLDDVFVWNRLGLRGLDRILDTLRLLAKIRRS